MADSDGFRVAPAALRNNVQLLSGQADQLNRIRGTVVGTTVPATAFGGIPQSAQAASELTDQLRTIGGQIDSAANTARGLSTKVGDCADAYARADNAVAESYRKLLDVPAPNVVQAAATDPQATTPSATAGVDMRTDQQLHDQLVQDEDNRRHVYVDSRGHPTVGIGFNLDRADARAQLAAVGADYDAVRSGRQDLTTAQVDQLFSHDVAHAVDTARGYYDGFDQLDPARQRVLTNMAFNMGAGTLGQFRQLHTALENGDYDAAANAMQDSAWARQVGSRATRLIDHMRTGQ